LSFLVRRLAGVCDPDPSLALSVRYDKQTAAGWLPELHAAKRKVRDAREPTVAILPVPLRENGRKDDLSCELSRRQPACVCDVLGNGIGMSGAQLTPDELTCEPELDVTTPRVDEFLDIEKLGDANLEPGLLMDLSHRGLHERLIAANAAAGANPEVVVTDPMVAHQEHARVVLNDHSGGNTVEHV
jgi:hypothetical protein